MNSRRPGAIASRVTSIALVCLVLGSMFGGLPISDSSAGNPQRVYANPSATVTDKTPGSNALDVAADSNIWVQFSTSVNSATVNENTFNVDGSLSGKIAGDYSAVGADVTFNPTSDFKVGETVTVSLTTGIQSTAGDAVASPVTWQFVVATRDGSGSFSDSGQTLGSSNSLDLALGDVDGDGDLDCFVANFPHQANKVWLNDGSGTFSDSGQSLGSSDSWEPALGDLDGDGDLDALVANTTGVSKVWLNDGTGTFHDFQRLVRLDSRSVALGDLDGDGDLDAFSASHPGNKVWLNDGSGTFSDSGQSLGSSDSHEVALGDLDGDGDLDALVANFSVNKVWLNDGSGAFSDSGQSLGGSYSYGLALGDLDGDGDLDAFFANRESPGEANKVWLNDGSGTFSDSG